MPLIIQTQKIERRDGLARIKLLTGKDLRPLADRYGITVWKNNHKNKGWAGQVIEHYLGLPQNSLQAPDFGTWELKVVPLRRADDGTVKVKESMAITMIEPDEVLSNKFKDSHLYDKLRSVVVVARIFENVEDTSSILHSAAEFDLDNPAIYKQVEQDYEDIRGVIRAGGIDSLTGDTGKYVQARTKGRGHGSTSRAFYARASFVAHILNLHKLAWIPKVWSAPIERSGDGALVSPGLNYLRNKSKAGSRSACPRTPKFVARSTSAFIFPTSISPTIL